jgi:hypothetical protein
MQPQPPTTETPQETLPAPAAAAPPAAPQAPVPPPAPGPRVTLDQLIQLPESEHKKAWIDTLVQAETARMIYAQDRQFAMDAYASGQFDDLKKLSPQQGYALALMKLQIGRDWGLTRADSVKSVYFVGGRPSLENELVASRLFDAGIAWDFEDTNEIVQHKNKPWKRCIGVTLWLRVWNVEKKKWEAKLDRNGEPVSVSFTEADADHAEIYEGSSKKKLSEKWNYQSWGRDMYYWRAVARVKRYHAPNVLRGGVIHVEAQDMPPLEPMPPELAAPVEAAAPVVQPEIVVEPAPEQAKPRKNLRDRIIEQEPLLEGQDAGTTTTAPKGK